MSVELESKTRIANLISAANAKTGGSDTDLTSAVAALIAGFGQGGGGGFECGEFTHAAGATTIWEFNIPVSSKKTHLFLIHKSIGDMVVSPTIAKCLYSVYAEEDVILMEVGINAAYNETTNMTIGASYWYPAPQDTIKGTFTETNINVKTGYTYVAGGEYYWFAW